MNSFFNLKEKIKVEYDQYKETNSLRNPFKDMEVYVLPLLIAAISWFLSTLVSLTCRWVH